MIKLCGIAILCAAAAALLRDAKSPLHRMLPLAGGICLLIYAAASIEPSISLMRRLAGGTAVSEYIGTLVKALGISWAAELTADVCRSCGAEQPATAILLVGRAELVLLACPLLANLLNTAATLIG